MKQRRHSATALLLRGVVAAVGSAAMITGVYPVVPHIGMMVSRARKSRASPAKQARVLAREWALAVAMSAARPTGFFHLPVGGQGPRPIVMVHGYAMGRAGFLPLACRLAAAKLGPIAGFEYWTLGRTADAARALAAFCDEVRVATGAAEIDLIGHSMGGVVGRYYVQLGGGDGKVRNLITLGSPHHGTDVSAVGIGRPAKELFFGSILLQRLEAAPLPRNTKITVIWSRSDALVPGARQARLPGVAEIVYDDLGHLGLLADARVGGEIIARLREA
jgi:triacylglycerol lipase